MWLDKELSKENPYCDPDGTEHYPGDPCEVLQYQGARLVDPLSNKLRERSVERARRNLVDFLLTRSEATLKPIHTYETGAIFNQGTYGYGSIFEVSGESQTRRKASYRAKREDNLSSIGGFSDSLHLNLDGFGVTSYLAGGRKVLVWFLGGPATVLDNNRPNGLDDRILEDRIIRPGFLEHTALFKKETIDNAAIYTEIDYFCLISSIGLLRKTWDRPQRSRSRLGNVLRFPRLRTQPTT